MAQESMFWETTGTGDGPATGYTMANFLDFLLKLFTTDQQASQGVLKGVGGELAVTGSASPLTVADGAGIAYGFFYENTAAVELAVASPIAGTTGGRVNLKVDWSAQTVRLAVQLNTDGVSAIPALVQTAGSEWNIPLCTFTISPAGTITRTDARSFCQFASVLSVTDILNITGPAVLGRAGSTAGPLDMITPSADGQVLLRSGSTLAFGQVATAGIADDAVTQDKIADGAVGNAQLAANAIGAGNINDDAIDDSKVGERVPQFYRRQGGSSTAWATNGTTTYTPGAVRAQFGAIEMPFGASDTSKSVTVTFPAAFSNTPIVLVGTQAAAGMNPASTPYTLLINAPGASSVDLLMYRTAATDGAVTPIVHWFAIGPE